MFCSGRLKRVHNVRFIENEEIEKRTATEKKLKKIYLVECDDTSIESAHLLLLLLLLLLNVRFFSFAFSVYVERFCFEIM